MNLEFRASYRQYSDPRPQLTFPLNNKTHINLLELVLLATKKLGTGRRPPLSHEFLGCTALTLIFMTQSIITNTLNTGGNIYWWKHLLGAWIIKKVFIKHSWNTRYKSLYSICIVFTHERKRRDVKITIGGVLILGSRLTW